MKISTSVLIGLGFADSYEVSEVSSIIQWIAEEKRCGIYILHFANGEFYAGKAVDVTRRFLQHRKTYADIVRLSFKTVPFDELNKEEQRIIHALEGADLHLRNKVYASVTFAPSEFDEIMPPTMQERWQADTKFAYLGTHRPENPELRMKYTPTYQKFQQMPYANEVVQLLRTYVSLCVPAARETEIYYWSCSCLPDKRKGILSRININQQEVFTVYLPYHEPNNELACSWHLAYSDLKQNTHTWFSSIETDLYKKYGGEISDHAYKSGGQDQISLHVDGFQNALRAIQDPRIVKAARVFNLRLMKKGTNLNWKSHCVDLADRFFE